MDHATYSQALRGLGDWLKDHREWPDSRDPEFHKVLFPHKVTAQDFEKAMVCHIAGLVALDQPYGVASGVARVIRNRSTDTDLYQAATKLFPPTVVQPGYDTLVRLLHNVDALFDGSLYDTTNGSTEFKDRRLLAPGEIPYGSRVTIGDFVFHE